MASDFEKQQRWQLLLFTLVLWGPIALAVLAVLGVLSLGGWLFVAHLVSGGGGW